MVSKPEPLQSLSDFLFNTPLYAPFQIEDESHELRLLYRQTADRNNVDGYCVHCKNSSTFKIIGQEIPSHIWQDIENRVSFDVVTLQCAREPYHLYRYWIHISKLVVRKAGQNPSLADVSIEETRARYKDVLKGDNWSEIYKAIGLAAHGEGIGSFVYLRRIFERLVQNRFDEHAMAEGWSRDDFLRMRMDEKVAFLKDHLPAFLVENKRIYGIFSKGIHELDNDECLDFFPVGKESIAIILEEDLRKKEEADRRSRFSEAISKFGTSKAGS